MSPDQHPPKILPAPTRAKSAPRLKELLWSERRGELMHAPSRKAAPKWLGLTKAEWLLFGSISGGAFVVGVTALQFWR